MNHFLPLLAFSLLGYCVHNVVVTDSATLSWLVFTNKGPRERGPLISKVGVIFQWCVNALLFCVVWADWAYRVNLSATF
jgi:hypothetical protein